MIVINEDLLVAAAKAVAACLQEARTTSGKRIGFNLDDAFLRRGVLSLIAMHEPCDWAIGVMADNTQFIHTKDDGTTVSFPPLRPREDKSCHS